MKKCFKFSTWEEQKDVMISLDNDFIIAPRAGYNWVFFNTGNNIEQSVHGQYVSLSTPSDPILTKLCELTGAKIYGDYVVLKEKECRPRNNEFYIFVYDGDVFINMKNSGMGFREKTNTIILNTNQLYNIYDNNSFQTYIFENIHNYDSFFPNCADIDLEITKIKENPESILDARQSVYMPKTEANKFKEIIKEKDRKFFEIQYFERIAPSGYNKYCNIFQEYSKFLRNEESKWEEVKKIVN
jgi:hypothetical protein